MPDEIVAPVSTEPVDGSQDTSPVEPAGNGDQQTQPEKVAPSQAEIDRVVSERLARAERKWQKDLESRPEVQFFKKAGIDPATALVQWEAQATQAYEAQGLDPAIAQRLAHQQAMEQKNSQTMADMRLDIEETKLESKFEKKGLLQDFEEHKDEARDLARATGMPLERAYLAVRGDEVLTRVEKDTEQRVLNRAKERAGRGVESAEGGGEIEKLGLSAEELAFARGSGFDPKEYAALKNATDLDSYNKLKTRK